MKKGSEYHYPAIRRFVDDIMGNIFSLDGVRNVLIAINERYNKRNTAHFKRMILEDILLEERFANIDRIEKEFIIYKAKKGIPSSIGKPESVVSLTDDLYERIMKDWNTRYISIFKLIHEKDLRVSDTINRLNLKTKNGTKVSKEYLYQVSSRRGLKVLGRKISPESFRPPKLKRKK